MQPLVMLFPSIYHTGLVFDPAYGNKVERQHENFVGEVKISTEINNNPQKFRASPRSANGKTVHVGILNRFREPTANPPVVRALRNGKFL